MGKLMHNTQIKHSSHQHLLQLSPSNHINCTCAGCNLSVPSSENVYACPPCNFFLHQSCSKFPELITHPSHPQHTLSLLPTPIYPGGFFRCDACAHQGPRFSYHCQFCDFDLHVLCASKPLSVNHAFHPHPLVLTFASPYGEKSGFSCDVCSSVGSHDQWLYRCVSCEFDAHLHCATAKTQAHPIQHSHSLPAPAHQNQFASQQPLSHSMSTGHVQNYGQIQQNPAPVGVQYYNQPQPQAAAGFQSYPQQPQMQPQGAVGAQRYPMQPQPQPQPQPQMPGAANQNGGQGNGLADAMVTGFVEGMMQQIGQNFVQDLTGGGGGGGGGCGGDGGGDVVNIEFDCSTTNDDYDI